MTVKERLIEFIKFKGISTREFCRIIGVSETYVSSMRSSLQPDKIKHIMDNFPELSMRWLFTGEGEMIKKSGDDSIPSHKLVEIGSEVFKDKLIEMFKNGEIFSASIVWEQHRLIIDLRAKVDAMQSENEKLKILLAQHNIPLP